MSGTASVPGWYVEFQASVLRQLPRPGEIAQTTAEGWSHNQGGLKKVLARALLPPQKAPCWREADGVIYFSVTSDGTTGEEWITRLESKGFSVGDYAQQVLRSPDFKPTNGVTTEVAVLKGALFKDGHRTTENIRAEGALREFLTPNPELACLIRLKFKDKEIEAMGLLWIITMHEPIEDSHGSPRLFSVGLRDRLEASYYNPCNPGNWWAHYSGFVFAVPSHLTAGRQVGPQA